MEPVLLSAILALTQSVVNLRAKIAVLVNSALKELLVALRERLAGSESLLRKNALHRLTVNATIARLERRPSVGLLLVMIAING